MNCVCRTRRSSGTVNTTHHAAAIRNAMRTAVTVESRSKRGPAITTAMATMNGTVLPT